MNGTDSFGTSSTIKFALQTHQTPTRNLAVTIFQNVKKAKNCMVGRILETGIFRELGIMKYQTFT